MFLTSGARPRRHSPVLENQNLLPFRTPSASEFGNWKKMESNWTEPQESDPVGPARGLRGLGQKEGYRPSALFYPPPPPHFRARVLQSDPSLPGLSGIRS